MFVSRERALLVCSGDSVWVGTPGHPDLEAHISSIADIRNLQINFFRFRSSRGILRLLDAFVVVSMVGSTLAVAMVLGSLASYHLEIPEMCYEEIPRSWGVSINAFNLLGTIPVLALFLKEVRPLTSR